MKTPRPGSVIATEQRHDLIEATRRAFGEFLTVPTLLIAGFLLLAVGSYALDHGRIAWLEPARAVLKARVFADGKATSELLSTIAGAGHGIGQLEMIAWTSISTAKSDPAPGIMAIHNLRDLLARWAGEGSVAPGEPASRVIYTDTVPARLMNAFESVAVVSTESMQHQTFAEVLRAFAVLFNRLPPNQQARTEDLILRILSGLGDHILTAPLEKELSALATTLADGGRTETAAAVRKARDTLARSVGSANSRSTRLAERKAVSDVNRL